ncbi:hypothetical protein [Maribacter sp.]|uniref:hypothetical protein n=1 Tax=Maribacter sp. TaxID=1897614 RepID=UPI003299774D
MFWKSEYSQPFFDFAHLYGIRIDRTVDYTDLVSLLILPVSYIYWNWNWNWNWDSQKSIKSRKILKPIIIGINCFAFIATTLPKHYEKISMKSEYSTIINYEYQFVRTQLNLPKLGLFEKDYYGIELLEKKARIITSIKVDSINKQTTRIALDSILSFTVEGNGFIFSSGIDDDDVDYVRELSKNEIEQLFSKQLNSEFAKK